MVTSHSAPPSRPAILKARRGRAAGAVAVAALWLLCGVAGAADKARKPSTLDDLKPAYATAADVAEGKRVADGMCAAATARTASAPPRACRTSPASVRRTSTPRSRPTRRARVDDHAMASAVKFLNDDALVKVAAYYASLDPAAPAAAEATSKSAAPARPGRGRQGRGGGLRRLSRRDGRQHDARHAEPRRASIRSTSSRR